MAESPLALLRFRTLRYAVQACASLTLLTGAANAGDLTFSERIAAQRAVDRVYYSHQLGATAPFDRAVPLADTEGRVRKTLRQSAALERFWNTPVTADMLRREMERMQRGSALPERLREIYEALDRDVVLFQETVVRSALVDSLARNFQAYDQRLNAGARREIEALRSRLARRDPASLASSERVHERFIARDDEDFDAERRRSPRNVNEAGPIAEERDAFVVRMVADESDDGFTLRTFVVPKTGWDDWWASVAPGLETTGVRSVATADVASPFPGGPVGCDTNDTWDASVLDFAPERRNNAASVWTGSLMLVWGGGAEGGWYVAGDRYDPAIDVWTPMSVQGAPSYATNRAIWTGSLMLFWKGSTTPQGHRYDPVSDTWTTMSTAGAPTGGSGYSFVWTGDTMIVWGGSVNGPLPYTNAGGRYNPATDSWQPTSTTNAPIPRTDHTAVWTGSRMIVWGGFGRIVNDLWLNTGGSYDPVTNTWTTLPTAGAPAARRFHAGVFAAGWMVVWGGETSANVWSESGGRFNVQTNTWAPMSVANQHTAPWRPISLSTGDAMLVWGSVNGSTPVNTGGFYDPVADVWTATSTVNAPQPRELFSAVWTGTSLIVWGGSFPTPGDSDILNTGGRYDRASDSWTPTAAIETMGGRREHTAVWTGTHMVIWGGIPGGRYANTGGRYDPATDTWSPTTTIGAPSERGSAGGVWTGSRMLVWGGTNQTSPGTPFIYLATGGRYDPLGDTWEPISSSGAPSGRARHATVWAGRRMIVWGGYGGPGIVRNDGALYDPATDVWTPMSAAGAPTARFDHAAAWAAGRMIVWGGEEPFGDVFDTGGRYDPATDTWMPTTQSGALSPRYDHTAVSTGSEMFIWGGVSETGLSNGGALYDPIADAWTPSTTFGAPSARTLHSAIWTGTEMIVWGGGGPSIANTGGRIVPRGSWSPTSLSGAAPPRMEHTALWTGNQMIVWGGGTSQAAGRVSRGGRYCACIGTPSTFYFDLDGDGHGDAGFPVENCDQPSGYVVAAGDCNDSDVASWMPPGESGTLHFSDQTTLGWDPPGSIGSTTVQYDVLRSGDPSDFVSGADCVVTDGAATAASDAAEPSLGAAFFYLVRAVNACPGGIGPLGAGTDGVPRSGRTCPGP